MNLTNLCKKIKSKLTITNEKSELLLGPTRATKAYPFGKGVSVILPSYNYVNNEYMTERNYLESFGYEQIEMKLYDYDRKLFFDYIRLMYDKDIGMCMSLSQKENKTLSLIEKIEALDMYNYLPGLKEVLEILKEKKC